MNTAPQRAAAADVPSLLTFDAITKRYGGDAKTGVGGTIAVDDITLSLAPGEFCVILGASGAGKSTLLKMVNGMIAPTSGNVTFDGQTVTRRTLNGIQPRIGMIHQQFHLAPRLSVLDNVLTGALPKISTWAAWLHLFPQKYIQKACHLLADVGLEETHLTRRAMHLSGGQQQRVAIARAFLLDPVLVLADEPVASLDPATSRAILDLLQTSARRAGCAVLCSLHQVEYARQYADRIVGMRHGKIVFDGLPAQFDAHWEQVVYEGLAMPTFDEDAAQIHDTNAASVAMAVA